MQKNESALPPPVPPRRRRCKVEPKRPAPPNPRATKSERKHRPAPPLPPPAAPQRSKLGRKTPSPFPNCSPAITKSPESLDYADEISRVPQRRIEKNEEPPKVANVKKSGSPFSVSPEPNKYPPLYFTFQDFQTVMEGSLNQWKSVQNLAEAEEKLEEIITSESENEVTEVSSEKLEMNSELIIKINQAIVESKATTNQREKSSEGVSEKIGKNAEAVFSPFVETVTFNNEREEIYFRVTTTDRPFEKFLGEWNKSYDNDVEEFSENQCSDLYIFEDYIDRSNRLNARPQLLFSEDFFSMPEDNNSVSTEKSTTKVRFLIESPSTSTPDLDLDDDGTSYGEYVERQFENYDKSSVQLVEVTDEELSKLNENANSVEEMESDLNAENKFESGAVEDENLSESSDGLTRNQSNESYSDWEEDAEVFNRSPTIVENSQKIEPSSDETTLENNQKTGISTDETVEALESDENTVENQLLENKIITSEPYQEYWTVNEDEQACNKTVIFIDSSLYNLSNEEGNVEPIEDTKTKEIPKIIESFECYDDDTIDDEQEPTSLTTNEENTQEPAVETISETVSTVEISPVEEKPVSVNVSRNSFLETMLSDNNSSQNSCGMSSVNCEVIAAHPKQESSSTPAEQQNTKPAAAAVDTEAEVAPRKNSKIKLTEPGARPKSQPRINANPSNNKSAGEVKSDVLNELLSNFSAIKLRSVNTNTRESIRTEGSSDQMKPVEAKTDDTREIKSEDVESSRADSNSPPTKEKSGSGGGDITPSVHKDASAIVKEAPYAQRNHNDNKAMTPVVVSKDQFREAVSITPGSVRSFVKYYEIHSEISSISKLKDNAFKKQKSELAREKDKAKKTKKSSKTAESNNKSSKARGIEESRKVTVQADASGSKPIIQQQSCMRGKAPSPKPERKKSVQFDKECTVINPPKKEKEKDDEEGTFSSFIGGIRTRLKGKAPAKPDVKKNEQPKGLNPHQRRTESAAIICIQKSPEAKAVACTSKPGNSFLPNNETLQNNQTIVFYCTV